MGNYFTRISEGDKPDMATGLTPRQKKAIRENWEAIYRDVKGNGTELFVRYIQANPEYKNLFQSLKEVKVRDVGRSHKFRCHASIVMHVITILVDNIHEPECLARLLLKTGRNHALLRGMTRQHFVDFNRALLDFLAYKLTTHFNQYHLVAWHTFLELVLQCMELGMPAPHAHSATAATPVAGDHSSASPTQTTKKKQSEKLAKFLKQGLSVTTVGAGAASESHQRITFEDGSESETEEKQDQHEPSTSTPTKNQPFVVDISELLRAP